MIPGTVPPGSPPKTGDGSRWAWAGRSWKVVRRGFTLTVGLLLAITFATGLYAFLRQPDTSVPQPPQSEVGINFEPQHQARSPVTVNLWLSRDRGPDNQGPWQVTLDVEIDCPDLAASPDWQLQAIVPSGATVQDDDPQTTYVASYQYQSGTDIVTITPGPIRSGRFDARFVWDGDGSGPLQVREANLVASFPDVVVENYHSSDEDSVPAPEVTVQRRLTMSGDFAYVSGPPPDQLGAYLWSWNPETGPDGISIVPTLTVEARSASADELAHSREFQSGIAYGIAASALIGAVQEYFDEQRGYRRKKRAQPWRT